MDTQAILDFLANLWIEHGLWIGIGFLAILALLWVRVVLRQRFGEVIAFTTPYGKTTVTRSTIVECVARAATGHQAVAKSRVKLRIKRKLLHITVSIEQRATGNLPEISRAIEQRIRDTLSETLGIEQIGPINIRDVRIVGNPDYQEPRRQSASPFGYEEPRRPSASPATGYGAAAATGAATAEATIANPTPSTPTPSQDPITLDEDDLTAPEEEPPTEDDERRER